MCESGARVMWRRDFALVVGAWAREWRREAAREAPSHLGRDSRMRRWMWRVGNCGWERRVRRAARMVEEEESVRIERWGGELVWVWVCWRVESRCRM